jgi:hypothetical protein
MTTATVTTVDGDRVFRAFTQGDEDSCAVASSVMVGKHAALFVEGVLVALRSEECVVFDACPHTPNCRRLAHVTAHVGRAGVHALEHFADDEVFALDHAAFVDLATRLGAVA